MKKSLSATLFLLMALVLVVSACSNATTPASTEAGAGSEVDEVKALIDERCSVCHSVKTVYNANYDEAKWSDVIDQMISKGADVSDEEKSMMIDWLLAQP